MIVQQIDQGRAEIENQYGRVVRPEGNVKALEAMARTMVLIQHALGRFSPVTCRVRCRATTPLCAATLLVAQQLSCARLPQLPVLVSPAFVR